MKQKTELGRNIISVAALVALAASSFGAEWEMAVSERATVSVLHRGEPVVEAGWVFWNANWRFAGARATTGQTADGVTPFTVEVPDLGLKIAGRISRPSPRVLQFDYELNAARALSGIVGGGLEFNLNLTSPSFAKPPPAPVLLDQNRGWKWPHTDGSEINLAFEPGLESVYFERGQKNKIRAFLVGPQLAPGKTTVRMRVELPPGGQTIVAAGERYGPLNTAQWHRGALRHDRWPVDVSYLNEEEKPAGRRGFLRAEGDQLVFADDTPMRFWGGNLAAYALFASKEEIRHQAKRISALGFNLMRLHHHDSMRWVTPTVIDKNRPDSRFLDAAAMDKIDWWIKCLRDEGVYVWLDLHAGRQFKAGDGLGESLAEIERRQGEGKGFNYFNPRLQELMLEFQAKYAGHVNRYTGLAYRDDPAVAGFLITNENDITHHFGNLMLGDKGHPVHHARFLKAVREFAAQRGLPADQTARTWEPGPSKIFLNEYEYRFNRTMLDALNRMGVRVPVATTDYWGNSGLYSLPALTAGDLIDAHSYGQAEALSANPRYAANFISWIGAAQVYGKPLAITEWNVEYPAIDRFTAPLYLMSVASLQGWDAPMIYNYSQRAFGPPARVDKWSTFFDPALMGVMPAAAVAFREAHVRPARKTYCLQLDREQLYYTALDPAKSAAIRTLLEQSRFTLGLPDIPELDWDRQTTPAAGVQIISDPHQDFIPAGQDFVISDTAELKRDWKAGWQTIDTPRTQAAAGWIGGRKLELADATVEITTAKATVALTSLDGRPLSSSRQILLTLMARVVPSAGERMPFLSEPVAGRVQLRSFQNGLKLVPLDSDGAELAAIPLSAKENVYTISLPAARGTHWFLLK